MNAILFRLKAFVAVLTAVLILGTAGFSLLEEQSVLDALYFSVVTVATVGYGDIHPVTGAGKLLAVLLIVTGVGTFLGVVANGTELLLVKRQERLRKERLNMIIALFFSEIGNQLLAICAKADPDLGDIKEELLPELEWSGADYRAAAKMVKLKSMNINPQEVDFSELRSFMREKTNLVLRLLENPNLVEHELFTDLLRAVFHMKDELLNRTTFVGLPEADSDHLAGDLKRIYKPLVLQWIDQMEYQRKHYPYFFSLAARINPFKENPEVVIR